MGIEVKRDATTALAETEEQSLYLTLLDEKLSSLAVKPDATLESVINEARGVFPTLVLERLQSLGLDRNLAQVGPTTHPSAKVILPELHPLNFEWYFTAECADYIAALLTAETGDILCLGTPTVALASARHGRRVLLLDDNPFVADRLPRDKTSPQFIRCDLNDQLPIAASFPTVFFDAPWYLESVLLWLWQAAQAAQIGGLIAFSLFPPLLRPGAMGERDQILEQARSIGELKIQEEALVYETPLFERVALSHCGIRLTTDWRRGDLVLIRVAQRPNARRPVTRLLKEEWESFLVGEQVVKLRRPTIGRTGKIIAPLMDCPDFIFPSVSLRDPRRNQIDLWTSRNRVARVGRRGLVATILSNLAQGMPIERVVEQPELSSLGVDERKELLTSLYLILEKPLEEKHGDIHNSDEIPQL